MLGVTRRVGPFCIENRVLQCKHNKLDKHEKKETWIS